MKRPPLHGLLPSLFVLVAVFYFINAACLNDGSDVDQGRCGFASTATVSILEPEAETTITGEEPGAVEVHVRVRAMGVAVVPASNRCRLGQGHFVIDAHRTAAACPPVVVDTTVELDRGELETTLKLFPGVYQLRATIVSNLGPDFPSLITDTHLITVAGTLPDAGTGPCQ